MFTFPRLTVTITRCKDNLLCAMLAMVTLYAGQTGEFLWRELRRIFHLYQECLPTFSSFFEKYLLPEVLTHKHEHPCSNKENEKVFCTCRKPESGRMIACENPECNIVWFHYRCVGIKRAPRGRWYCSSCKKV